MSGSRNAESPPTLISLEQQEQVALKLLHDAAAIAALSAQRITTDPTPAAAQVAALDDATRLVRRRFTAWHTARTQLGAARRDDRRQT